MAKLLALDWDQNQLRIVLANRQGKQLTVEELRSVPLNTDTGTARSLVEQIRDVLASGSYRNAEALVTVRRADAEVRLMNLPPVPSEELPAIVRMQALREFSEVSEDWPIDFLRLQDVAHQATVLAAIISPQRKKVYEQALVQADLKPRGLVLRPTATAQLVKHLDEGARPQVEICVDDLDREVEMSVLRDGVPILIRTIQAPRSSDADRPKFLCQEIRRTILAARNQLHGDAVEQIVMFGTPGQDDAPAINQIRSTLGLPVRVLDPFANLQFAKTAKPDACSRPEQFAAAVGLLCRESQDDSKLIDFLNPRKVTPPKSNRNLLMAAAIVGGVCLLLGVGGYYWRLHQLDQQARELQLAIQQQKKLVEAAQQRLDDVNSIRVWQRSDINWLTHLAEISSRIPDAHQTRFSSLQAGVISTGDGQITLNGLADEQSTIGSVVESLRSETRSVRPAGGTREEKEEGYPWEFKETITIQTQPSAVAQTAGPASTSSRMLPRRTAR